jgi:C4-dicarboxylate transporter/malic acid transport protein
VSILVDAPGRAVAGEPSAAPTPRSPIFGHITPNWFAAVMGTGIVANAAATLRTQAPGQHAAAAGVWLLASVLLVGLTVATGLHWLRYRERAARHHRDPVMAHFYGAPPMALLTVGAGTLLLGKDLIGFSLAVRVDWVLWTLGSALGLATAVVVPYLMFTRQRVTADTAFGGWLMPVVPPMVSAATGALLLPHLPAGPARLAMLVACYAMFGLSLLASLVIIPLIWGRLGRHGPGPAVLVPTLFIVLGPLGQSVTAANLLGGNAHLAVSAPYARAFEVFGVVYGVPVMGFALIWGALAATITVRTVRTGLPFALTWWSFTFPVGTCVTGLTGLAVHTGSTALEVAAATAFAGLLGAWLLVATRTVRCVSTGVLLRPPVVRSAQPSR